MPYLILGGAQLAVGAAAIFARFALSGASPLAVAAARLVIAAFLLAIFSRIRPSGDILTHGERRVLGWAGVALAAHFATWIGSLDYTTVAVSTLLVSTTPIWTALYDAVVHKATLPRAATIAFVAGAIGLGTIVRFDVTPAPHPHAEVFGDALALAGAVAFAAYLLLVRRVRDRLATRTIVSHTYAWAAAVLVLAAAVAHQGPPPFHASAAWGGIAAMALISQLLGHTAINASLRWFSPSAVAFSTLLEPVIAAVLALVVFRETLPPVAAAGGLLVLGSIGVVLWTDPKPKLA